MDCTRRKPIRELLDAPPPHDLDAERSVLRCILADPKRMPEVLDILGPEHFHDHRNGIIFGRLQRLHNEGTPFDDIVVLANALKTAGELETAGGPAYLAEVMAPGGAPSYAAHHARIVLEKARRRSLVRAGLELIQHGHNETVDVDQLHREALELLGPVNGKALNNIGGAIMSCLTDVQPVDIEWLWPGRIAIGKTTLVAGDPGLGKSLISLDIASRVSRGLPWPDALQTPGRLGSVVLLTAEDDPADTIRPRLDAAGADPNKIHILTAVEWYDTDAKQRATRPFSLDRDLPALEQGIVSLQDCCLVIIDPISAYLGKIDSHKNAEVRAVLAPLGELAKRLRVAVVCISHLNKTGGPAMYRTMGSLAFIAAARAAWGVVKDKDNPTRRLAVPIKNNLATEETGGMAYTIMSSEANVPYLAWEPDPIHVTADEALATKPGGEDTPRPNAKAWLRDLPADGPVEAEKCKDQAERDGIQCQ